ncbi:penicillin-binding transpeptidase domain-containing protein [Thermodesulfobacteriota bacterium]
MTNIAKRPDWRAYQESLKRAPTRKRSIKKISKWIVVILLLPATVYGIIVGLGGIQNKYGLNGDDPVSPKRVDAPQIHESLISKRDVRSMLDSKAFINLKEKGFDAVVDGRHIWVDTSLDIPLQNFILAKLDRSTSRYIAIVAIDPETGRILSMSGFDKTNPSGNPCIDNIFPAASVFKIVTAAAAVEKCGFNPDSELTYNGRGHTLYKSQLKDRTNRHTNRITFRDSFAKSVNPVFGKIGALYLEKDVLEQFASAFGFNRQIGFELPFPNSFVSVSDEPYQRAEIACGFNRKTTITPLHGALMASAILNQGKLIEPTIVDQIFDEKGRAIYRARSITLNQAMTPEASKTVNDLMEATIRNGTCKKAFRGFRKDSILSRLFIGGKTGSINNKLHDARYEWFVGFAREKEGPGKIVLSVFVAHEEYIGIRPSYYARMIIKQYFRNYFVKKKDGTKYRGQGSGIRGQKAEDPV